VQGIFSSGTSNLSRPTLFKTHDYFIARAGDSADDVARHVGFAQIILIVGLRLV